MKVLMFLLIFLFMISIVSAVSAEETENSKIWVKEDTFREITWQIIHVVDWGQTLEIARHPQNYYEKNPFFGKHPSVGRVNSYMAAGAVAHAVISYVLPPKYRKWWQYSTIVLSGGCVINNFSLGIGVKF